MNYLFLPPGFVGYDSEMKTDLPSSGVDSPAIAPVAGRLVMARAIEIAATDGRLAINLSKIDWEQAKRELNDEED